eukprot:TRINITY_DN1169_c0_g1_i2.p1 TRINITY_DN1169_c0_g1~~TRINITY_DN1169_c0_g1_i2.p1  ORF type:complete len:129 (-),score=9.21 TRINITY_DN1169_c0_g1_i2:133-519(-)
MRILTHNLLAGPKGGYPLKIRAHKVEELESEYDAEYIKRLLAKIEWNGVISALGDLNAQGLFSEVRLPVEAPSFDCNDDQLLRQVHHVLNEITIISGQLECPETKSVFAIEDGIPRMVFEEGTGVPNA